MHSEDSRRWLRSRFAGLRTGVRPRTLLPALVAAGVVGWAAVLVATSYVLAQPEPATGAAIAATSVHVVAGLVCHQRPARSFHPWGRKLPVCARCAGLYGGALGGLLFFPWPAGARRTRTVILATAVPTAGTFLLEAAGIWDPGNTVRFAAALPLGASVAWFVANAARGVV